MKSKQAPPVLYPLPDDPRLRMVKRVSKLMDEQFSVGGFKFGLDPLLNFIPVIGDMSGFVISAALVLTMAQHGASGKLTVKMLGNAALDALVGAIPVLGWVFDFTFKANTRNIKLLSEHYTLGKHRGSGAPIVLSIVITALIVLVLVLYLAFKTFQWFIFSLEQL